MTEAFGVPLGLFGLTLLLAYAGGQRHIALLYLGLALFSIGMFARMGALFVLPLLALWVCVVIFRSGTKRKIIAYSVVLGAVAAGPVLQVLLLLALGGDPANSGGNFATTLYGLSTGSRDWHQGYRDFPQFFLESSSETAAFAKLQAVALANIRDQPAVFLHSLFLNVREYATGAFRFGLLSGINDLLTIFWLIGVTWCVAHARRAPAALLLAVTLGEFISVPLVFTGSSDHRVLAVSVAARLLLVGVGLSWVTSTLLAALGAVQRPSGLNVGRIRQDSEIDLSTKLVLAAGIFAAACDFYPRLRCGTCSSCRPSAARDVWMGKRRWSRAWVESLWRSSLVRRLIPSRRGCSDFARAKLKRIQQDRDLGGGNTCPTLSKAQCSSTQYS